MLKNKLGEDSPIPKFMHLKIQRRDGVESLTTLEEGEFKVPIDDCINIHDAECHSESIFTKALFYTKISHTFKNKIHLKY